MNFMKLICENAVTEHSVTFYADYCFGFAVPH